MVVSALVVFTVAVAVASATGAADASDVPDLTLPPGAVVCPLSRPARGEC